MISHEEALRIALGYLEDAYQGEGFTFLMEPEKTTEYRTVWAIRFDTQERRDSGNMTKAPFMRVLVVPKDGSAPRFPPSAHPLNHYVAQLEAEL
ncbi:YrhB domain-containing protein [Streptomyces sp. DSM 44915]|uniref:YrhB domain-containing protein n=1 Tax=Streptomyces chisholmiae TaxID=3075540 RepID=A0ABU2JWC0_9ACTN|nr:YrhB domain-containing protein [Streptomyces sp. DSM 44915]MDT0269152.1 YrhB domain-containing protein [Streptomyces sp. DSM 44915]